MRAEILVTFGRVVPKICVRTDRQTDRQTRRQTDSITTILRSPTSLLRELACHTASHSATCHPTEVTFPSAQLIMSRLLPVFIVKQNMVEFCLSCPIAAQECTRRAIGRDVKIYTNRKYITHRNAAVAIGNMQKNFVKFDRVVFQLCERTDRQTNKPVGDLVRAPPLSNFRAPQTLETPLYVAAVSCTA